ncbi:MAG: hypothetical protein M8865_02325 [marine benthic group bacterium]|nr:hypothetical protein [Gemmatimonadota bacterium]
MRRLRLILAAGAVALALPPAAAAQVRSGIGVGGKLLFPTGSFDDEVKTGWGIAGTGEIAILGILSGVGELSYNRFPAEDGTREDGTAFDNKDVFGLTAGARVYLSMLFAGVDLGYFTAVGDGGVLPNVGLRIALFELMGRYKWSGDNWFEVRGMISF